MTAIHRKNKHLTTPVRGLITAMEKYMVNASPELDALALFGELRHVRFKSRQDSAKFRTSPTSSKKF
jgi:hypothetical protein